MDELTEKASGTDECRERVREILSYHECSKHHLHRYSDGPANLDWANQPDPFRTYAGAPTVDLPLLADALVASYADLYTPGAVVPRRPALDTVAILFELALGLSAWKEYQASRWALRCNPSSGNLHPTDGYAVLPPLPGLEAGVYHYVSRDHCLERRCTLTADAATALARSLPARSFLVGLSSVHWREAWKYGVRAYRYCQHDAGHALAAVRYAAAALGWSARLLDGQGDALIAALLGLDRDADGERIDALDREHPDALLLVGVPPLSPADLSPQIIREGSWAGMPNRLSRDHARWESIDRAAAITWKPNTAIEPVLTPPASRPMPSFPPIGRDPMPAATLIRRRRSAVGFDGRSAIDAAAFYHMLDRLQPRPGVPPWDLLPWRPRLHAGVFVHRVRGVPPGLYFLERDPTIHDSLRTACRSAFLWQRPVGCPEHLHLYLLAEGDMRVTARTVSCHQDIAGDGAFSLGMIAEFGDVIRAGGPWWYRRLFWEAGVLGHVLYLEAEAEGVRGTGIGCYFDDAMHEALGLVGDRFQSLYHFSVGGPVDDPRLRTLPPYSHLVR
ncbi:MAG TPA: SagB/ThcOx family dehydrogenase [Polyangiaceae bacterium]|nr:SagB/ThcOx family dehydrogenase [Polyangiaceae bacterium]